MNLNKNNNWLKKLLGNSYIGILVVDKNRKNLFVNEHLCEMYGYEESALLEHSAEVFHVNHETYLKFAELAFDFVVNGKSVEIDYQFKRKDGKVFWAHISGDLVKGENEVLWTIIDISQRKEAEEKIAKLQERQELALIGNHDGLWDWNLEDNSIYFSPRWKEMLGYSDNELKNEFSTWEERVHPDDLASAEKRIQENIDGKTGYYESVHRLKHKDGSWVWILDRGKTIFDKDGKAVRMSGTHTDITEQKQLESSAIERGKILDNSVNEIYIFDANNYKFLYFNKGAKNNIGYTLEEIQNLMPTDIKPFVTESEFLNILKPITQRNEKSIFFSTVHQRKDGTRYDVDSYLQKTVFDSHDAYVAIVLDVTKRNLLSKKLEDSYSMLEKLANNVPGTIYQYRLYPDGYASFPYASDGIRDLFEVKPKDITLDVQPLLDILHPDDLNIVVTSIQNSAKTMNDWNLQYRVDLPKKGLRWLEGFAKPEKLEDGSTLWHGYIHDITDKKNAEDLLKEQHKYLQSIIDGVDDPIMVIQEDYTVQLMNSTLRKSMKDLEIADPLNPKCYEISHHRSTPCEGFEHPCPLRDVLATKKHTSVVHNHDTKDGKNRYIELSASPLLDKDKKCIGIIESARDITGHLSIQDELREQKNILDHQAHHDALTGLPNRVLFNDRLEQAIEKAKRNNSKIALLFIDLDHFKEINDSLGHNVGDEILKEVTVKLQNAIRDEDTLARLGGDEFTVILEDLHAVHDASLIATKILKSLAKSVNIDDNVLYVSSSIGISIYPDDGESTQSLLKFADAAMYKAKDEGRNNYQYYNSTLTELAFERVVMETSLRVALTNEEFVVYYQAQVNGVTNKLIGMEALVRWQHPTMGLVFPDKFIPLAESTGLIVELDRYVMKTAMSQLSQWYKDGLNPGKLAMNLAIKQFQQEDFIVMFENLIEKTNCKTEWLELEVTEGQIMTHPEDAIVILQKISDLGIELAVDDFGTGYSSLAYLKRLPIDKLKIDQAFIRNLPDDEEDSAIAKAVIALAKSLNLKIIAEGVQTKEQKDFLVENGCENIQGYFYSKPVSADEFEAILRNGFNN